MNERERNDLLISWVTLSVAFAFVLGENFLNLVNFATFLPISFAAVGTAFVFHELAHRTAARAFGAHAEFRAWKLGLMMALVLPIISGGRLLFAAPGAVYIHGPHLTRKQNGLISLSGPATNILVGGIAIVLFFLLAPISINSYILQMLAGVFQINLFIAFFNLIPFPPLDGSKVINWNAMVWAIAFIPLALLLFLPFGFL